MCVNMYNMCCLAVTVTVVGLNELYYFNVIEIYYSQLMPIYYDLNHAIEMGLNG